jgi:hypothetical protein
LLDPAGSMLDRSESMADYGASALCRVVDEDGAFLPPIVEKVASYVFRLVSEFVRSVYIKLLAVGPALPSEAQLLEAGRTHLLNSLMDWPLKEFNIDSIIDGSTITLPSLTGGPPMQLGLRGLITKARDWLIGQMSFLDVAIGYAMKSFHTILIKASTLTDANSLAMEPLLAIIPSLHATLFRNVFLPFWTLLRDAIKRGAAAVLGPVLRQLDYGGAMGTLYDAVDKVDQVASRAQRARDLLAGGVNLQNAGQLGQLGAPLVDASGAQRFGGGGAVLNLSPLPNRKTLVRAAPIPLKDHYAVKPNLKWNAEAAVNETDPDATVPPPAGATP